MKNPTAWMTPAEREEYHWRKAQEFKARTEKAMAAKPATEKQIAFIDALKAKLVALNPAAEAFNAEVPNRLAATKMIDALKAMVAKAQEDAAKAKAAAAAKAAYVAEVEATGYIEALLDCGCCCGPVPVTTEAGAAAFAGLKAGA